jgi:hypothetical protein
MGNGLIIHTLEVSFVDPKTGRIMDDHNIQLISKRAFDFSRNFYEPYKNPSKIANLAKYYNRGVRK